jgi:ribosomal protein S27E
MGEWRAPDRLMSDTAGSAPDARSGTQFRCAQCGSRLVYSPETANLRCVSCGSAVAIAAADAPVEERDLEAALASGLATEPTVESLTVGCSSCGAQSTLDAAVVADHCAFCGTAFVASASSRRSLRPHWLLPFRIGLEDARRRFGAWVHSLWFAPNRLKQDARAGDIRGMYVPYWTFDAATTSRYAGQRGDDHEETETSRDGKTTTRTVTVWTRVQGTLDQPFDDVLVMASRSLPESHADGLHPWDLEKLVPYRDEFLSGFRAETYQVPLPEGYEKAKTRMAAAIRETVRMKIGGDHQQIDRMETMYSRTSFKHVLLPIWISSYRFGNKTFRFLVNARTGEVQGDRPYSLVKIALAVMAALLVVAVIIWMAQGN